MESLNLIFNNKLRRVGLNIRKRITYQSHQIRAWA